MWARLQNLSSSTSTAASIPNLIFTDYAAAAVVGTKGVLGPGHAVSSNSVAIDVTLMKRSIRYHWLFAIPALLVGEGDGFLGGAEHANEGSDGLGVHRFSGLHTETTHRHDPAAG